VHPRNKASKDDGGPFSSRKLDIIVGPISCQADITEENSDYINHYSYSGIGSLYSADTNGIVEFNPEVLKSYWATVTFPTEDLSEYGSKAFFRLNPLNRKDIPNAFRSIGELMLDGLPQGPIQLFNRLKGFRSLSKEYLNYKFGWLALLSDIDTFLNLFLRCDDIMKQLFQDNQRNVRRHGTLSKSKLSTDRSPILGEVSALILAPAMVLSNYGDLSPPGTSETWTDTEERVWFAGKGSYVLTSDLLKLQSRSAIQDYLGLLHANLSPLAVYELIPWTWLFDWFSDFKSVLANGLGSGLGTYTADYCYLMRERRETTFYSGHNVARRGFATEKHGIIYPALSRDSSIRVIKTTKERIAATPFGFGLTLPDLSTSQWAILTALGLSRLNFLS
jgi:hypothetical protein